jgi:hypothetical protein
MMEALRTPETLLNFHQRSIPEDSNLQNRFRDNPTP